MIAVDSLFIDEYACLKIQELLNDGAFTLPLSPVAVYLNEAKILESSMNSALATSFVTCTNRDSRYAGWSKQGVSTSMFTCAAMICSRVFYLDAVFIRSFWTSSRSLTVGRLCGMTGKENRLGVLVVISVQSASIFSVVE